jgi:enoyl-CoA hydratase
VPADQVIAEANLLATEIAKNDALAVRMTKQAINRSYDIAGMREALLQGLELDIEIEATETEESREFNEIVRTQGTKAAIAWRDARFDQEHKTPK